VGRKERKKERDKENGRVLFVPCKVATIPRKMQKKSGDHPFRKI